MIGCVSAIFEFDWLARFSVTSVGTIVSSLAVSSSFRSERPLSVSFGLSLTTVFACFPVLFGWKNSLSVTSVRQSLMHSLHLPSLFFVFPLFFFLPPIRVLNLPSLESVEFSLSRSRINGSGGKLDGSISFSLSERALNRFSSSSENNSGWTCLLLVWLAFVHFLAFFGD